VSRVLSFVSSLKRLCKCSLHASGKAGTTLRLAHAGHFTPFR
jgi:hypothetical protein